MLKLVFAATAVIIAGPAFAQDTTPPPAPAAQPVVVKMSEADIAHDPRMIAAIRHANMTADKKCGEDVGGLTDIATKAAAQRCRRRMVENAKLDAESEIAGH